VICSGLIGFYTAEQLTGKHIIVAYNLKARKMRGIESKGMLLAAGDMGGPADAEGKGTERVDVIDAGDAAPGTRIGIENAAAGVTPPEEISIDQFFAVPLCAKGGVVRTAADGRALLLNSAPLKTAVIMEGEVH
jgi:methionyl-tRNA synthetase